MNTGTKWVLAQFAMLVLIGLTVAFSGGSPTAPTTVVAIILFLAGQGMAVAAVLKMRQYISAHPAPAPGASLLNGGIYGLVRHPMYGGVLLVAAAISIFDVNWIGLALTGVLAAVFHGKATYEEGLLEKAFLGYAEYRKQVTRRFIPWVL